MLKIRLGLVVVLHTIFDVGAGQTKQGLFQVRNVLITCLLLAEAIKPKLGTTNIDYLWSLYSHRRFVGVGI